VSLSHYFHVHDQTFTEAATAASQKALETGPSLSGCQKDLNQFVISPSLQHRAAEPQDFF